MKPKPADRAMHDVFDVRNAGTLYDLLLPGALKVIANLHWGDEPLVQRFSDRPGELVACRLGDHLPEAQAGRSRGGRRALRSGFDELPFAAGSLDCVLLHRVLDDPRVIGRSRRKARTAVMRFCKKLLAPSGVLAISFDNRWRADRIRRAVSDWSPRFDRDGREPGLSLGGCRRLLRSSGLTLAEAYAVMPNLERPAAVVSTREEAAKAFYQRAMDQMLEGMPYWAEPPIRILHALNRLSYFQPAFIVLARHD
jgi:SAM-dependent methyltransferase